MAPKLARPHVRAAPAPDPPPEAAAPGERMIKLNTNENPFPPSPKVVQAIREIEPETLRRYPDSTASSFRAAAARANSVADEMILPGNGADDLLAIATRTFVAGGGTLASPEPTYPLYGALARLSDAKFIGVEWDKKWALPAEALLGSKPDAIFIANPNWPSGTVVSAEKLAELAATFSGPLVIDETYADFADENCLQLVRDLANVVIVRSMSQSYSLAGLRVGYIIAQPDAIEEMNKVRDAYNCDAIATTAAIAALDDRDYAARTWEHVRNERARLTSELSDLGYSVAPSQANFILATCPSSVRGRDVYTGLKQQGILVRHFDRAGLADKICITIGTSQENNALVGGIKSLSAAEKAA